MSDVKSVVPGSRDEQVKAMAYRLWLEEGCPEGRAEAHWFQAVELVEAAPPPPLRPRANPGQRPLPPRQPGRAGKAKSS